MVVTLLHNFGSHSRYVVTIMIPTSCDGHVFVGLVSHDSTGLFLALASAGQEILHLRVIEASFWFFPIVQRLVLLSLNVVFETIFLVEILLLMRLLASH